MISEGFNYKKWEKISENFQIFIFRGFLMCKP
jgi:hypothetical protein